MNAIDPHARSLMGKTDFSRRVFMTTTLSTGFALAVMPVSADTITTDSGGLVAGAVTIPVKDGNIPGYRAMPATGGPFPTVAVIQEIFGVHEHIQDVCRRFAKLGYFAVAPALYARQGDVSQLKDVQEIMQKVVSKVPDAQVASDLDAAVAWADGTGRAKIANLGVTGFCWGGRQTWLYAAHNPKVKAAVAWYGPLGHANSELTPSGPLDIVDKLTVPVLGLYGAADGGIPVTQIQEMQAKLKAANKSSEIIIYPDTPHGFHADYRPSYRPEQAKDGWNRLLTWFKGHGVA